MWSVGTTAKPLKPKCVTFYDDDAFRFLFLRYLGRNADIDMEHRK